VLSGSDQPCNSVRVLRYLGFLLGGLAGEQGQRWTGHGVSCHTLRDRSV
jgi:hypothetical protein